MSCNGVEKSETFLTILSQNMMRFHSNSCSLSFPHHAQVATGCSNVKPNLWRWLEGFA